MLLPFSLKSRSGQYFCITVSSSAYRNISRKILFRELGFHLEISKQQQWMLYFCSKHPLCCNFWSLDSFSWFSEYQKLQNTQMCRTLNIELCITLRIHNPFEINQIAEMFKIWCTSISAFCIGVLGILWPVSLSSPQTVFNGIFSFPSFSGQATCHTDRLQSGCKSHLLLPAGNGSRKR